MGFSDGHERPQLEMRVKMCKLSVYIIVHPLINFTKDARAVRVFEYIEQARYVGMGAQGLAESLTCHSRRTSERCRNHPQFNTSSKMWNDTPGQLVRNTSTS